MRRRVLSGLLILVLLGLSTGCSSGVGSKGGETGKVLVPDVLSAVHARDFRSEFSPDPKVAAIALHSYVDGALEAAGLKSGLVMQSADLPDSQEPPAGSLVDPGTEVTVRIGVGE